MAFLKCRDERNGRTIKFASAKRRDAYIAKLLREQERLISGKTLDKGVPTEAMRLGAGSGPIKPRPMPKARQRWDGKQGGPGKRAHGARINTDVLALPSEKTD